MDEGDMSREGEGERRRAEEMISEGGGEGEREEREGERCG